MEPSHRNKHIVTSEVTMVTRSGTDRSVSTNHQRQAAKIALQQRMEAERKKRHHEKQLWKEERQLEEEARKRQEDDERRAQAMQEKAARTRTR
jgi:hypothetical protein